MEYTILTNKQETDEAWDYFGKWGSIATIGETRHTDGTTPKLVVYYKRYNLGQKKKNIPTTYKGYDVKIEKTGAIRPCKGN